MPRSTSGPKSSPHRARHPIGKGRAGNRFEHLACLLGRDGRAVGDPRDHARRRLRPLAHPAIQIHERGPEQWRVVHRAEHVAAPAARIGVGGRRGNRARGVLGARQEIDAHLGGRGDVALAHHVGVHERAVAAPVLGGAVDAEDLRHATAPAQPLEQRPPLSAHRILLLDVRERKEAADRVHGIERWLAEAAVELPAPRPRHVGNDRVEDGPAALVFVQGQIEHVPQESTTLRDAEHVGTVELTGARIPGRGGPEPQEGRGVAHRGEAQPHHGRILGAVVALVDLPGLEAAREEYEGRIGDRHPPVHARESPGTPRHRQLGSAAMGPHGQLVLGIVGLGHGMTEYGSDRRGAANRRGYWAGTRIGCGRTRRQCAAR